MHYEDKIYDITALEMFKRLEVFFTEMGVPELERVTVQGKARKRPRKFSEKVEDFRSRYSAHRTMPEIIRLMGEINGIRNRIVHPPHLKQLVDFSIEPIVVLQLGDFEKFRHKCIQLEGMLQKPPFKKNTGMSDIMIPTLKYEMGNIGDIVKHGLLAEFVDWWCMWSKPRMVFADTFAGCPWGGNPNIHNRMQKLSDVSEGKAALVRAYKAGKDEKYRLYLGSSHLASRVAKNCKKSIRLVVSDKDENARSNLAASDLQLASLPNGNDGFAILDKPVFSAHRPSLILLDPYGEFLREEFHSNCKILRKIADLTELQPNLWVTLFVLDMWPETGKTSRQTVQETHDRYAAFRDQCFKGKAVYLRCLKAKKSSVRGEKNYDMEVLLISKQLQGRNNADVKDLLRRLEVFAGMATNALAKEKGLVLAGGGKVECKEV